MIDAKWVIDQTNRPLPSDIEAHRAEVYAIEQGLPFHNEHWKNWDSVLATAHCVDKCPTSGRVLDAGACRDPKYPSAFLPGLGNFRFDQRWGINLDEQEHVIEDGAHYQYGDITDSPFPSSHFGFAACLSTIEHGVDEFKFLREMGRIIAPGGHLFVSFDYWHDPIDVGDRTAFGAPVRVFNKEDVLKMVEFADRCDLILSGCAHKSLDLRCHDKVVRWLGLEYTFMNLLFRKVDPEF